MDAVREDIKKLVEKELRAANEKFPQFRSLHEGAAVMLEESEELREEVMQINGHYQTLWNCVRGDEYGAGDAAESIKFYAIRAAVEAVQVAAMAEKFLYALEHDGEADERGYWIFTEIEEAEYRTYAICSKCGHIGGESWILSEEHFQQDFERTNEKCNHCGADMRKGG